MFRHWLQLFRAPNLFTVPGDPLAGFLLASGATNVGGMPFDLRAAGAVLASLCLYAAGLAMNDLFDLAEDLRDRPNRPLTSGAISARAAWIACGMLILGGIVTMSAAAGLPGAIAAVALAACITLYNGWAKRVPVLGAMVMGTCRGMSVSLGAVACLSRIWPMPVGVLAGAALVTLYIAAVTNLARHETQAQAPSTARLLPVLPPLLGVGLTVILGGLPAHIGALIGFAAALLVVTKEVVRLFGTRPPPLPPVIGSLIRVLLLFQAALCLAASHSWTAVMCALVLVALMPVARSVGRRFYAS